MKKKNFLWGIFLTLLLVPLKGKAYDFVDNGIQYTITSFTDLTVSATGLEDKTISELVIPEKVEYSGRTLKVYSIGYGFVKGNDKVQKIIIIPSLRSVGDYAFSNCTSLKEIKFSECIDFGEGVFYNASSLKRVQIPYGLKTLETAFFKGCSSIEEIILPNSINTIEKNAFEGCTELKSLLIPSSVNTIKNGAFLDCRSLNEIIFENSTKTIDVGYSKIVHDSQYANSSYQQIAAFKDCPLKIVKLGRNIKHDRLSTNYSEGYQDYPPFYGKDLDSLIITSNVRSLSDGLFIACTVSGEVVLEDSSVALGTGEQYVGSYKPHESSFNHFKPVSIYIGRNIKSANGEFIDWIIDGVNLEKYEVGGLCTENYPVIKSPNKLVSLKIHDNVETIKASLCKNAYNLNNVELSSNVKDIGKEAFSGCTSLENFPFEQIISIGEKAFYGCSLLKNLKFDKIESIGSMAFASVPLIETLELPSSIKSISNAFSNCPLKTITILTSNPPSCEGFPNSIYLNTILQIPSGSLYNYQQTSPWKNFWNIEEFDIPAESIEIDQHEVSILVGEECQLSCTILPNNTTDQLVWSTSEPQIVSVSDNGLITGLSEGTAIITATVGNISATCEIRVRSAEDNVDEIYMENEESVTIFSIDGILLEQNIKVEEFDNFPKGIYIIRRGDKTIKIVK